MPHHWPADTDFTLWELHVLVGETVRHYVGGVLKRESLKVRTADSITSRLHEPLGTTR